MSLRPFAAVKNIVYAALLLIFLVSAIEVGLRIYATTVNRVPGSDFRDNLVVPCWETHHRLRPLQSIDVADPESGQWFVVHTNSFGLRGDEIAVPKPSGIYRIVCLGDEHVLAAGSDRAETFCERLREQLQQRTKFTVEVVNAGVPGYCPLLSYLQVKHRLLVLQPDLLILNIDMSDISDDQKYRRHTQTDTSGVPLCCPNALLEERSENLFQRIEGQFVTVQWCKSLLRHLPVENDRNSPGIQNPAETFAWTADVPGSGDLYTAQALSPIDQLRKVCEANYIGLVAATYPAPWQIAPSVGGDSSAGQQAVAAQESLLTNRVPFDALGRYLEQRAIPFCDASRAFAASSAPAGLYLKNSSEFSAEGHRLYATELASFLVRSIPGVWTQSPESSPRPSPLPMATRPEAAGKL